jgi:uncharacterized protein YbjT (DUF2867 family)
MKIIVIGGTGLIGTQVVAALTQQGHEAVPASPNTGVDTITGAGLAAALAGAQVVVDVSNSPSFADDAVLAFFETSTANLLAAEAAAGVGHHVALSVVGTDRPPQSGYFRAKLAQETLIRAGSIPFSILHATQFFEFVGAIAATSTVDGVVRLPPALIQPMASSDVAAAVAEVAVGAPLNDGVEIAGPQELRIDAFVADGLAAADDPRPVVAEADGRYFGVVLGERTLLPDPGARLAPTTFADWLTRNPVRV